MKQLLFFFHDLSHSSSPRLPAAKMNDHERKTDDQVMKTF